MPVIINELEATVERDDKKGDAAPAGAPAKLQPAMLRLPLHRIVARERRLMAH